MALRILHSSDLHGNFRQLLSIQDFDVWLDTGDFFPNISRGSAYERPFQKAWFTQSKMELRRSWKSRVYELHQSPHWWITKKQNPPYSESIRDRLLAWLAGRPMIGVPGNHDWQSVAKLLGGDSHYDLHESPLDFEGHRWAGFREIPYIAGEWMGEAVASELRKCVDRTKQIDPTIVCTHAPPGSILDDDEYGHHGVGALTSWLMYEKHNVKHHFFGHVHDHGGRVAQEMGVAFYNGATKVNVISV